MDPRPALLFPPPSRSQLTKKSGGASQLHLPSSARQVEALALQFERLEHAFEAKRIGLAGSVAGATPEQVVVLEIAGTVENFVRAVKRVFGIEWLAEWSEEDIPPDEDFYQEGGKPGRTINGRVFLLMTDQRAMSEILRLWNDFQQGKTLPRNFGSWLQIFRHLRNVRLWGPEDRVRDTGLQELVELQRQQGAEYIRFEAELWFSESPNVRANRQRQVQEALDRDGGHAINWSIIPEIGYHAVLGQLPVRSVASFFSDNPDAQIVLSSHVMYLRPIGQTAVVAPTDEPQNLEMDFKSLPLPTGDPVIALFDGFPLANHEVLQGRVIIDDPDGWEGRYPATERNHGTAMASLIVAGDLNDRDIPLPRPIYVRPVLLPASGFAGSEERMPTDVLPLDLLLRSVRRLFDGDGTAPPVGRSVRVINFSLGDPDQQFDRHVTAWGRFFDWIAWKYNVLVVVSAGNHVETIELDFPSGSLSTLSPSDIEKAVLSAMSQEAHVRRLLVPAEGVNVLTVAASHSDSVTSPIASHMVDVLSKASLPSPINRVGFGYRRAVKPEILAAGGRQPYAESRISRSGNVEIRPLSSASTAPGQRVAAPGVRPGDLTSSRHTRGTSNAAALTSRYAGLTLDRILQLRDYNDVGIDSKCVSAVLKALIVHCASWQDAFEVLQQSALAKVDRRRHRDHATRFLGYGTIDPARLLACTDQRVTVIGWGSFTREGGLDFQLPLPPSLSGKRVWRRLTLTLAWLTPIAPGNLAYRCAALSFSPPVDKLDLSRKEADWQAAQRGTVQHEILEGERATAFVYGDTLTISVVCREQAGGLRLRHAPFGLIATLEVAEETGIPVYEEIRQRIRPRVSIPISSR